MPCKKPYGTITTFEEMNKYEKNAFLKKSNIVGQRFGRLVVLEFAYSKAHRGLYYKCQCDCGNVVFVPRHKLLRKNNPNRSCGCIANEIIKAHQHKKGDKPINQYHTHNLSKHPLYKVYYSMKTRALHPNTLYKKMNYLDRGIGVCDEWLGITGFKNFYDWAIANGWNDEKMPNGRRKLTLDRIDNDKGYSPDNCRWATHYQQVHNRRKNRQNVNSKKLDSTLIHYKRNKWGYKAKDYEKVIQN